MADTDLPGRRTATREGWEAKGAMTVSAERYDVVLDFGDFNITLSAKGAQWLAAKLSEAALTAERTRRNAEPVDKTPWTPGAKEHT